MRLRFASSPCSPTTLSLVVKYLLNGQVYDGISTQKHREYLNWLKFFGIYDNGFTDLGKLVIHYDRYFEDYSTLLLFQFNLVKSDTLFNPFFNYDATQIDKEDFIRHTYTSDLNINSMDKDFNLIINTYDPRSDTPDNPGSILSPLKLVKREQEWFYKPHIELDLIDPWLFRGLFQRFGDRVNSFDLWRYLRVPYNLDTFGILDLIRSTDGLKLSGDTVYINNDYTLMECIERALK